MDQISLEERVAALENQVNELRAKNFTPGHSKDWRKTRGAFTGDDLMKQVFEEGRKLRQAQRKPNSSRRTKRSPTGS